MIVANGGEESECVSAEEAADHFRSETANCDDECDYEEEEVVNAFANPSPLP